MWFVYVYIRNGGGTYNGKGSRSFERAFADQPSAMRFAQNIVETGPASHATVERRAE